jgi:hypothetical protein
MNNKTIIASLVVLADELDKYGLYDASDKIIKISQNFTMPQIPGLPSSSFLSMDRRYDSDPLAGHNMVLLDILSNLDEESNKEEEIKSPETSKIIDFFKMMIKAKSRKKDPL